ncbi:MAG TPA: 3-hydroxyacyl-CoA dehydrogenase NAD-binding domain-containing protein [Flavitalea sp.]|nr:3-hydroxyacyl-CoA dehydrogenase NAD-binding domain-containing protein [Flavitalea sp.]
MNQGSVNTICVCGAGTMGCGIAQVAAQHGFNTILYDVQPSMVEKASVTIERNLSMMVEKGKLEPEEKEATLNRLNYTYNISDCKGELVIEAIIENVEAKATLFNQLSAINNENTILATNTSSLSVSHIASGVKNSKRVVGMHFFNPAPLMKLVEIVRGHHTSDSTVQTACSVARQFNKTPVLCKDLPGFIVNHVARPYYIESLRLIEEGISDYTTIDTLLESCGFKMGPFRLMDLIGNDINFAVSSSVYQQLGEPLRLKPSTIQEKKVKLGELGRKTGKGYYDYNSSQ